MSPLATTRSKTTQSSSMARRPTKELIEATSLEGFWPQKEICNELLRGCSFATNFDMKRVKIL